MVSDSAWRPGHDFSVAETILGGTADSLVRPYAAGVTGDCGDSIQTWFIQLLATKLSGLPVSAMGKSVDYSGRSAKTSINFGEANPHAGLGVGCRRAYFSRYCHAAIPWVG